MKLDTYNYKPVESIKKENGLIELKISDAVQNENGYMV